MAWGCPTHSASPCGATSQPGSQPVPWQGQALRCLASQLGGFGPALPAPPAVLGAAGTPSERGTRDGFRRKRFPFCKSRLWGLGQPTQRVPGRYLGSPTRLPSPCWVNTSLISGKCKVFIPGDSQDNKRQLPAARCEPHLAKPADHAETQPSQPGWQPRNMNVSKHCLFLSSDKASDKRLRCVPRSLQLQGHNTAAAKNCPGLLFSTWKPVTSSAAATLAIFYI